MKSASASTDFPSFEKLPNVQSKWSNGCAERTNFIGPKRRFACDRQCQQVEDLFFCLRPRPRGQNDQSPLGTVFEANGAVEQCATDEPQARQPLAGAPWAVHPNAGQPKETVYKDGASNCSGRRSGVACRQQSTT